MLVEPLGEGAYLLRDLDVPAHALAAELNSRGLPGLEEAVASYETVGLYVGPQFSLASLEEVAEGERLESRGPAGPLHLIPVCYELGEDLEGLAVAADEVVRAHTSVEYTCYAVGFCPGFAYLGYLPEAISGVARRAEPRVRVEPGSVGITGRQTGVYPLPRPGGWALIGRTPLTLVDVVDAYFPIKAGDRVRFSAIAPSDFEALRGERL